MEQQQDQNQTPIEVKKPINISTPAAIITAGVVIALALVFSGKGLGERPDIKNNQAGTEEQQAVTPPQNVSVLPTDHVRGDLTKAEVIIVEYSDSDCPFCQRFHVSMQEVLKKYGNKVAWVYRHFPLSIHPNANNEAYAMECVASLGGNEKFWSYLDNVIDITVSPDKSQPIMTSLATGLGIDAKAFETCITSSQTKATVEASSTEAQALGARGTPYSIAIGKNGQQIVIPGAVPTEDLIKTIDGLLK